MALVATRLGLLAPEQYTSVTGYHFLAMPVGQKDQAMMIRPGLNGLRGLVRAAVLYLRELVGKHPRQ